MVGRYFTDEITTYRSTASTRGVGGESVKTWTTCLTVIGSFQNAGGDWRLANDVEAYRKTKRFFCDPVDILDSDRIVYANKTYEITNVANMWDHHLEIDMKIRSTA